MHAASTFLAFLLLGGGPPQANPSRPADDGVRVQVRLLTMKGLDWRGPMHHRLVPAARQGTATIWTANQDILDPLQKGADSSLQAPTVCANLGASVHIEDARVVNLVADLRRVANGPPGENTSVAFAPEVDALRDGFQADVSCRKVDQGMMVRLACSDSRVAAIHTYAIRDGATDPKTKKVTPIQAQIQVPEVIANRAEGEWLVPTDGVLVVSLGAYTCDDGHGKAVTRERLAIVEPRQEKDDSAVMRSGFEPAVARDLARPFFQGSVTRTPSPRPAARPIAPPVPIGTSTLPIASPTVAPRGDDKATTNRRSITVVAMPVPGVPLPFFTFAATADPEPAEAEAESHAKLPTASPPGRNLPTPVAADGSVVPLPPLPDDEVRPASSDPDGKPRPAPQAAPAIPTDAPKPQASATELRRALTRHNEANLAAWTAADPSRREAPAVITARGEVVIRGGGLAGREIGCNDLVLYPAHDGSGADLAWDSLADPALLPASPAPACPLGEPAPLATAHGAPMTPPRPAMIDPSIVPALFPGTSFWGAGPAFRCLACSRVEGLDLAIPIDPDGDDACLTETGSLDFQIKTAEGTCHYDGRVRLKMIGRDPAVVRVPMADGSVVEIQAKIVKKTCE